MASGGVGRYITGVKKIHINRAGSSLGQFTPEEVLEGVRVGRFLPTDLAWMSGQPEWLPLAQVAERLRAELGMATEREVRSLPEGAEVSPAWERREKLGWFAAVVETVPGVLFQPGPTFKRMPVEGGLGGPLLYYLLLGFLGSAVGALYQIGWSMVDPRAMEGMPVDAEGAVFLLGSLLGLVIFLPMALVLGIFLGSGMTHGMLMLVGGAKKGFEATFRVMCYSHGTCALLQLIPFCGSLVFAVYGMVVSVVGLARAHGIEVWQALVAVLLPAVICMGLIVLIVVSALLVGWQELASGA